MREWQHQRRQALLGLLGDRPQPAPTVGARLIGEEDRGAYVLETLLLDLNGLESVPAHFTRPRGSAGTRPRGLVDRIPVVLYCHAHGFDYPLGKQELLVGRAELQTPPYAEALAAQGIGALAIDAWGFGERRGRSESELFKQFLWEGRVLWGMMLHDSLRAIDYLVGRPDVDPARLATLGLSMGSLMAWWVAALDERVSACVDLCCLGDFRALIETRAIDEHGLFYFVPGLLKQFDAAEISALIAPRPHLALAGNFDRLTPGLDRIDAALRTVYRELGAADAWRLVRSDSGHYETAAMRAEVMTFLDRWL
jgi:hypothetical protein